MNITATVENDMIRLPAGVHLPDGTRVEIMLPEESTAPSERRTVAERYAGFVGIADDVPSDLARNLDHYVHGQQKQP